MISDAAAAVRQTLRHARRTLSPVAAGHRPGSPRAANAAQIRAEFREEFEVRSEELLLVQIGSGFKTKGLDRSLKALAALPRELSQRTRLLVIGQDDPKPFKLQAKTLGVSGMVEFQGVATSRASCLAPTR